MFTTYAKVAWPYLIKNKKWKANVFQIYLGKKDVTKNSFEIFYENNLFPLKSLIDFPQQEKKNHFPAKFSLLLSNTNTM